MLKIAVTVKQVPKGDTLMDNKTGLLIRKELSTNPYDYYALESALRLKDKYNAIVDVFSLCPKIDNLTFTEYYSLGVDNCYHISDVNFKGADVLATAKTISEAIKLKGPYDLVITGRNTTDGDTSAVGSSIAASLRIPSVMYVKEILEIEKNEVILTHELSSYIEKLKVKMPAVLSVDKDTVTCRIPSLTAKLKAKKKETNIITLDDLLDKDKSHYGELGSRTKVVKIYEETPLEKGIEVKGDTITLSKFIINQAKDIK